MLIKLKNNRGSALTYVLVIMMLLSILGLSLISSTVINYKVNRQSNSFNKSFYITDGAIDETLAELKEITHRAEANATSWINDPDADFREEDKWTNFFTQINIKLESSELTSEDVVSITQTALEREFQKRYFEFLLEVPGGGSDDIFVDDTEYLLFDKDNNFVEDSSITLEPSVRLKSEFETDLIDVTFAPQNAENFESASIEDITLIQTIGKDFITLNIQSNGNYNDNRKRIEVELDITIPRYNYIVSTRSENTTINTNQILTNALIAREDIIAAGGQVTVNGDVYSYGSFPNREDYLFSELGGILVGLDRDNLSAVFTSVGAIDFTRLNSNSIAGNLTVNGDLKTRSSIRINADSSRLNVDGNIFANTYLVDVNADNFIGSNDGNLLIMEDMLLFGDDSNIRIGQDGVEDTGQLWTFLEGSPSGSNRNIRDLSGSIIIDNNSDNLNLSTNNYYVSGVAYIDIFRTLSDNDGDFREYYQSGESFTTNNNNNFYTKKIASTDTSTKHFEYTIARGPDAGDSVNVIETYKTVSGADVVVNDVNYKSIHFISKNNEVVSGYDSSLPEISQRDRSIFTVNSLSDENNNPKNNYGLGVILANDSIYNPYSLTASDAASFVNMATNDFESLKETNIELLDRSINVLATRDYTSGQNDDEKFDDFFNLSDETTQSSIVDTNNFIFINQNENRNIYINVPFDERLSIESQDTNALVLTHNNDAMTYTGAIITRGNIIINNDSATDFTFNGPLVSEQNILFYGRGNKVINNQGIDQAYSTDLIRSLSINPRLYQATNSEDGRLLRVNTKENSDSLTRSLDGNLDIDIIDNPETINLTNNSNVLLEGIIKTNDAKSIRINSWREVD